MTDKKLSNYTEKEFYDFITKIRMVDFASEAEHSKAIYEFGQLTEHPDKWDLIYRPKPNADNSTQGIINEIKKWRSANGRSSFKPE
ncbi:bacteriocin immunity protein [Enterobacter kobei]|uniref:Bacteriocin immunity protein n=1 Tax=Kluyvera ascorbata TaxID=51288 RepID=A0A3N2RMD0_9ENTR|nr:bacteriocin immunity protein [Kluyvera ascorbata]QLS98442.1 bacteriocin immunity protein [Citrobacter freundii]QLT03017.1 bacteriocin immunity protein [Citrobacter freundii]ROU08526.1 bacteriocin immunity protein [Kluyvera ascorbata]UPQ72533.1 bacteriocin immunity protein [Kluyvera ascorbata]